MKGKLIVAAIAICILSIGAFTTASAAELCGTAPNKEAMRHYEQEVTPLIDALQAKNIELSEANTFGISETLITKTPDIARIDALENDI